MEALGLSQDVIKWFCSYLSDRRHLVDVSGVLSSSAVISRGVPQGKVINFSCMQMILPYWLRIKVFQILRSCFKKNWR